MENLKGVHWEAEAQNNDDTMIIIANICGPPCMVRTYSLHTHFVLTACCEVGVTMNLICS